MKVFLSWSGERSQLLAAAVKDWLQLVLHYVDPWLSQLDIEAGERWATEVAKELEASNFGVIAITRENIGSPWILFEAGALARSIQEGRVVPLLLDIEFKDITGPLAQFQSKKVDKSGLTDVVRALNGLSEAPIPEARLTQLIDLAWPKFEEAVAAIPKSPPAAKHNRPQSEVLEELVTGIRGLDARIREQPGGSRPRKSRHFYPMLMDELVHSIGVEPDDPIHLLVVGSLLREDTPWIYELALEAYRAASSGSHIKIRVAGDRLLRALHSLRRGPLRELVQDKESHFTLREAERFMEYAVSRMIERADRKTKPTRRPAADATPSAVVRSVDETSS